MQGRRYGALYRVWRGSSLLDLIWNYGSGEGEGKYTHMNTLIIFKIQTFVGTELMIN